MEFSSKQKLGYIIKENRKQMKLSQKELAKKISYNQSVISKIENGNSQLPMALYIQLLKEFGFDYSVNEKVDQKIDRLIDNMYDSVETLNDVNTNEVFHIVNEIHHINRDVIRYYDLLSIELILYFHKSLFNECKILMEVLFKFYPICHIKCQFLFFYLNNYLAIFKKIGKKTDIPKDVLSIGKESGLISYMEGWTYINTHNYSQALTKFYQAIKIYKNTNNKCRIILCEIFINEILLMNKNYIDVVKRTSDFIKQVKACFRVGFPVNKLYFHLCYSYFHLKEYKKAKKILRKITYNDPFIVYLRLRIGEQFGDKLVDFSTLENSESNVFIYLYFKYKEKKDNLYYQMIENNILPEFDTQYYIAEYQFYILELLDYYWINKKYSKYKKLSDKLHHILQV